MILERVLAHEKPDGPSVVLHEAEHRARLEAPELFRPRLLHPRPASAEYTFAVVHVEVRAAQLTTTRRLKVML